MAGLYRKTWGLGIEDENVRIEGDRRTRELKVVKSLYEPVVTSPTYDDSSYPLQTNNPSLLWCFRSFGDWLVWVSTSS